MALTFDGSIVASTLATIVGAVVPNTVISQTVNEDDEVALLSYRSSFVDLWNFDPAGPLMRWASHRASRRAIIIVWDGMPDNAETVNVSDFVLPFDWAFALSMILTSEAVPNLPNLRIHILDLMSERHSAAFSVNSLGMLGSLAPWIQVYRPVQIDRIELAALFSGHQDNYTLSLLRPAIVPGVFGIEVLFDDLRNPDRVQSLDEAFSNPDRSNYIATFAAAYRNNILSAKTRHDVGNLLTPLLLVDALPRHRRKSIKAAIVRPYPLRTALKGLSEAIGLKSQLSDKFNTLSKEGIIEDARRDCDPFGRRSYLKVLLIDDQFSLGYHHLLATFLFGESYDPEMGSGDEKEWRVLIEGKGELRCLSTADLLFTELDNLTPIKNWNAPRLIDIGFHVLALDLRLWTNKEGRNNFFGRLVDLCRKLGANRIEDDHFKKALRSVEHAEDTERKEIEGLALLPLLLSHLDPSLPILLFSSTQQRAVAEMVSHRASIVSDFAKPIFSGYGEVTSVTNSISRLECAITKGIELHESRRIWEELVARARIVENNTATFEFVDLTIKQSDGRKKSATYEITELSITELGREFCEYISFGRFSDSLLAIGNWSEDLLGGKLDKLPATTNEPAAAVAAVKDLMRIYPNYEAAIKGVWMDRAYRASIRCVINWISSQIPVLPKRRALYDVLNRTRDQQPLSFEPGALEALGLAEPLPSTAEELLGRFLDNDADAQALLTPASDWIRCLQKDVGSVTIAVTNGFRNARAHRSVSADDSERIRHFAIWCWLWTLAGLFPTSQASLLDYGDGVGNQPGLEEKEFIHLKRPLVSSSLSTSIQGVESLKSVTGQLEDLLKKGWLKICDLDLEKSLNRLV